MLFNSFEFIFIFLPITIFLYFTLAHFQHRKVATFLLVISSLAFYAYWDIRYIFLLIGSILFNFIVGLKLERDRNKIILASGVIVNFVLLGYFKYTGFFISSINDIVGTAIFIPEIILPLGISFFTFTQTAYLVDVYRGETNHYNLLTYSLFVTFFPHLIAGPILYHKNIIPQFSMTENFRLVKDNIVYGIILFVVGLSKKVIIADTLAAWASPVFDNVVAASTFEAWVGAIGYTLQLYFDFSGYSEMAIGLGLMFNFRLPINFDSPYQASSIIDFWRRWHITLSQFLKNYLYIPLGGNRHGVKSKMKNLLITMLLGGLWHGANWNFIVWGGLHGFYLIINHLWRNLNLSMPKWIAWPLTFMSVVVAWVFFRVKTVADGCNLLEKMFNVKELIIPEFINQFVHISNTAFKVASFVILPNSGFVILRIVFTLFILLYCVTQLPNIQKIIGYTEKKFPTYNEKNKMVYSAYLPIILGGCFFFVLKIIASAEPSEFLYFNF